MLSPYHYILPGWDVARQPFEDDLLGGSRNGRQRRLDVGLPHILKSIRLAFVRAHIAAGGLPSARTPLAALVGLQKLPKEVTAAGGIAGVKRWTAYLQRHCLRGTSVLAKRAELGILVVEIPITCKIACTVAAQVVAVGRDRAGTVPAVRAVRDNAVLDENRAARVAESPAAADVLGVIAKGRIADLDGPPLL